MTSTARWMLVLPLLALLAFSPLLSVAEDEEAPERKPAYEPKTLAPSWRDQATAAYNDMRWADAIFLYRKWLEADPHDEGSWYNLACTYGLAKMPDAALEAFETAVDAGWTDTTWPTEDPDLASIRDEARFQAALKRCAEGEAKKAPRDAKRHWVKIPAMTTYLALLPPDYGESGTDYPMVVILHGNGSSETAHGRIADAVGREGVIYVVPRAPYPNAQVYYQMQRPGFTWAPQDGDPESMERLHASSLYVDSILAAVEDAKKRYRVAGDRFHVFGHSMGGFFANATAVLHPERVAAYFAYAGGLDETYHDAKWLTPLKEHGVKAWHVHGAADPVVPVEGSKNAHRRMEEAGIDSTLHLFDGVDHNIREPVRELLKTWIREVVRGEQGE